MIATLLILTNAFASSQSFYSLQPGDTPRQIRWNPQFLNPAALCNQFSQVIYDWQWQKV